MRERFRHRMPSPYQTTVRVDPERIFELPSGAIRREPTPGKVYSGPIIDRIQATGQLIEIGTDGDGRTTRTPLTRIDNRPFTRNVGR